MNGFASVLRKEIMHLRRDPAALVIALLLPLFQMIIFGFAIDFDVRHIPTAVADLDNSRESREFLAKIHAGQYVDFVGRTLDAERIPDLLRSGKVRVGIVIPAGFGRTQRGGGHPAVQVLIDGSDSQVSLRARFAFVAPPMPQRGAPDVRVNVLFNPSSRTATFMIPGLIAVILQIVTVSLTAFSIVREREQGTLEQLMVTPVGRAALMLGKIVPYAALALAELFVVVFLANLVFGVASRGSVLTLVLLSVPFVVASLALGLLISTVAKTQGQALQFTMLTMLPSILLSGFVSPRETMPGWLYLISSVMPATHYIQITRGIMVRGAAMVDLIGPEVVLLAIALVLIVFATLRFEKSIE